MSIKTNITRNSKIANMQIVLSFLIVIIHSMTVFINLPGSATQYLYGKNISTFVQLFLGEGVCRIAVPMFFVFSGYLFYKNYDGSIKSYLSKWKKRFFSLVIPYLFWSAIVFLVFFVAQRIPALSAYFTTRNSTRLSVKVIVDNVILSSYNSPLWYMRYLIVFTFLSWGIYWIVKKAPVIWMAICFCVWFFEGDFINVPFRMDAVFFYSLGTAISLHTERFRYIEGKIEQKVKYIAAVSWVVILLFRTIYYCGLEPEVMLRGTYDAILSYSGNIGIMLGIYSVWYLFAPWINKKGVFWKTSEYSTLIFVTHHPLVNTIKKILMKCLGAANEFTSLLSFVVSPILTIILIIILGGIVKHYLPKLWRVTLGGR